MRYHLFLLTCIAALAAPLTGCYSPVEEETEHVDPTGPNGPDSGTDRDENAAPDASGGGDGETTQNGGGTTDGPDDGQDGGGSSDAGQHGGGSSGAGQDGGGSTDAGQDGGDGSWAVTALPRAGSRWEGHVVALVTQTSGTEAEVLLLALRDFTDVYAPAAAGHEQDALQLMATYTEAGLCGWEIPTEAQARALRTEYAGRYEALNAAIGSEGDALQVYDSGRNARWLCEAGTKTYNWAKNGSVTRAGATVRYRLRGVKRLRLRLSQ